MLPSSACLWSAEDKCVGGRGNSEGIAPTGTGHLAIASMTHTEPQPNLRIGPIDVDDRIQYQLPFGPRLILTIF